MLPGEVLRALEDIVGKGNVLVSPEEVICYSYDANYRGQMPEAVVFPHKTEEVAEICRLANRVSFVLFPRGAGTGMTGGAVPTRPGVVVCLTEMKAIKEISPEDGIAVVEPGVLNGELQEAARPFGLFFPPDPSSMAYSTLGGNVAENAGGPKALKYGVTKDYVLALEVVTGEGDVVRMGRRTLKGVAGYDLVGLMVGSEGTLGIITEIILKLLPLPEASRTLVAFFPRMEDALRAVLAVFATGVLPSAMEFMDGPSLGCASSFLKAQFPPCEAALILEVEGSEAEVRVTSKKVEEACHKAGASSVHRAQSPQEGEEIWRIRRCLSQAAYALGPVKVNEDIAVPRSKISEAVRGTHQIAKKHGIAVLCFGHIGDGNLHVNFMVGQSPEDREKAERAVSDLFRLTLSLGGTLSGEHGIGVTKLPYLPEEISQKGLKLMAEIKRVFDPKGILNPGKAIPLTA